MPITDIDKAFDQIKALVNTFESQKREYLSTSYSEARVRQDFIDKFFEALGWDVTHRFQKNIYKQEVKIEEGQKQKESANKKRADYAFYIDPHYNSVKFFVEAKKPSRNLKGNKSDYFQTVKYGWNAQTGISVLTDFQEFIVLDCRYKPEMDTIDTTEIMCFNYTDYLDKAKFEKIYWLFSREAVLEGNISTFVKSRPSIKSRGHQLSLLSGAYQTIDNSFLYYIDNIRFEMAQAFYNRGPNLTNEELTEATQRTIDRLVFMRFLEDKQIEGDSIITPIADSKNSWAKFSAESKRLDTKYNGIVFKPHFIDKTDFTGADDSIFKSIITGFESSNSPYDFNYIPIHILGNIYEQFLGKVIEVVDNRVLIEEKPDVRKAGGVYYTPKFIVDYIVNHTVGNAIEGKSLNAIKNIRIADIACGSGSFLIGVYDYLLNYYKNYYNKYTSKAKEDGCFYDAENDIWILSIHQKQQILLNHVFGVDIDHQAVEVTQLSLFLKLLEDETLATANEMQVLFHEKILPDLTNNIKTGNSLIDYQISESKDFCFEDLSKINPFDFRNGFPKVFNADNEGFDILVGNPPYVKVTDQVSLNYFKKYYHHQNYQYDLYLLFLERFYSVLGKHGTFGVIIPNTWLQSISFTNIRKHLSTDYHWKRFLHSDEYIFKDAIVDTHCIIFEKNPTKKEKIFLVDKVVKEEAVLFQKLKQENFDKDGGIINILASPAETAIFDKIKTVSISLKSVSTVYNGAKPFEKNKGTPPQTAEILQTKPYVVEKLPKPISSSDNWLPLLRGSLINRYVCFWDNNSWINYGKWLAAPRKKEIFETDEKVVVRQTADKIIATIIGKDIICRDNLHIVHSNVLDHRLILGILNSKLIDFYYYQINPERGENLAQVKKAHIEQLPMPIITEKNKPIADRIEKNVATLLNVIAKFNSVRTEKDKTLLENHISILENSINNDVFQIFGLNQTEADLVESGLSAN